MPWVRLPERSDEQTVMGLAIGLPLIAVGAWALVAAASSVVLVGIGVVILLLGVWLVAMASSRQPRHARTKIGQGVHGEGRSR